LLSNLLDFIIVTQPFNDWDTPMYIRLLGVLGTLIIWLLKDLNIFVFLENSL